MSLRSAQSKQSLPLTTRALSLTLRVPTNLRIVAARVGGTIVRIDINRGESVR